MKYGIFALCAAGWALLGAGAGEPRQPGAHADAAAVKNPTEANEASINQGRAVYKQLCITCHAIDGSGKTDMVEMLEVPPASFLDNEWKYGSTDGEIFSVIKNGGQNGMQPFGPKIPDARIWNVVNYLRTFSKAAETGAPAAAAEEVPGNPIAYSPESVALGKQNYARYCVKCHGTNGKGDTEMLEFLSTPPTDLTDAEWKYGERDGDIFLIVKNGTEYDMTPFKDLLDDEKTWHIINFIRSLGKKD